MLGDLLFEDRGQVGEKRIDVCVDRLIGEIVAAVEMHGRRRRQRNLAGHLGHAVQELIFVERERLFAPDLAVGIRRGELDLMALVVAEFE